MKNDEHLSESLRRLPEAAASDGFTAAVLHRLAVETEASEAGRSPSSRTTAWLPLPRLAGLAAAVLAVVLAAVWLTGPFAPSTSTAPPEPAAATRIADSGVATDVAGTADTADSASRPGTERGDLGVELNPASTAPSAAEDSREDAPGAAPAPATRLAATSPEPRSASPGAVPDLQPSTDVDRPHLATAQAGGPASPGVTPALARETDAEERRRAMRRLRELRRQQEMLRSQLAALSAEAPAPTLILGGDESVEFVLDLASAGPGPSFPGARPASDPRPAVYRPGVDGPRDF